ncbi:MAG: hypothetical protein E7449_01040 [Ruminococcaceae bacterium]|nr:hypothetical protein [Oscillospiraceae bacterium]
MNVIFLDYDGVVNTPRWHQKDGQWKCRYGHPWDGKVNNEQAVQWVSEFCEQFGYKIVVTSTWRLHDDYDEMLVRGGLRSGIEILGRTPVMDNKTRGDEISQYLDKHPEITGYLVFDDEYVSEEHQARMVKCNASVGFGLDEYYLAETLHFMFNNKELEGEKS